MKNILNIIIICLVATVSANAQMATSRYAYDQTDAIVSPQSVTTTPRYSSPIYEPFTNSLPSDQTEVGAEQSSSHKGRIRTSLGGHTDPGEKDPASPIGDAVLPLLALALAFGAVTYFRRKRLAK